MFHFHMHYGCVAAVAGVLCFCAFKASLVPTGPGPKLLQADGEKAAAEHSVSNFF